MRSSFLVLVLISIFTNAMTAMALEVIHHNGSFDDDGEVNECYVRSTGGVRRKCNADEDRGSDPWIEERALDTAAHVNEASDEDLDKFPSALVDRHFCSRWERIRSKDFSVMDRDSVVDVYLSHQAILQKQGHRTRGRHQISRWSAQRDWNDDGSSDMEIGIEDVGGLEKFGVFFTSPLKTVSEYSAYIRAMNYYCGEK